MIMNPSVTDISPMSTLTCAAADTADTDLSARVRGWAAAVARSVPRRHTLPEPSWQARHRAVLWLLRGNAVGIAIYGSLRGYGALDVLVNALVPTVCAYAASRRALPRAARSCIGATGLMLTSAAIVHLSGGYI